MQHLPFCLSSGSARLATAVSGKVCVVTGASDGIGAVLARRLGAAGARVVLVARSPEKLLEVCTSIRDAGGEAHAHLANLADESECGRVVAAILATHGYVDILVSNAGRSIRRSAKYQGGDRFHDFHRLMQLNFFGGLKVALGVLPGMVERRSGHIIHISSFGVPTRQPRFAGYVASKSALDMALQSLAGEVWHYGVHTSSVYMPLVQTKMVMSKGHSYDHVAMLTTEQACEYIEYAIVHKQTEVIDAPSRFLAMLYTFRPDIILGLNSLVYRMEGEQPPGQTTAARARPRAVAKKPGVVMNVLTTLMWLFSRLELVLCINGGLPWVFRDVLVIIVLLGVLIVQPVCDILLRLRCCLIRGSSPKNRRLALRNAARIAAGAGPHQDKTGLEASELDMVGRIQKDKKEKDETKKKDAGSDDDLRDPLAKKAGKVGKEKSAMDDGDKKEKKRKKNAAPPTQEVIFSGSETFRNASRPFGMELDGALVVDLADKGSLAVEAGVQIGWQVLAVNGREVPGDAEGAAAKALREVEQDMARQRSQVCVAFITEEPDHWQKAQGWKQKEYMGTEQPPARPSL